MHYIHYSALHQMFIHSTLNVFVTVKLSLLLTFQPHHTQSLSSKWRHVGECLKCTKLFIFCCIHCMHIQCCLSKCASRLWKHTIWPNCVKILVLFIILSKMGNKTKGFLNLSNPDYFNPMVVSECSVQS